MLNEEAINPKDAIGAMKNPHSCVSQAVAAEVGVAMMEGARKYGSHNYRVATIRAHIYYDAARRHIDAWWEGEDTDPDSGLSHITKAISCLTVLRDGQIQGKVCDDRPPKTPKEHKEYIANLVKGVLKKYPESVPPYIHKEEIK